MAARKPDRAPLAIFLGVGSLFALSNDYSSMYHLKPHDTERLRSYSRFPQGLTDTLRHIRLVPFAAQKGAARPRQR